jgi:hypothetical protein
MKVHVAVRFTTTDEHFIDHFFNYYLNFGVSSFLINFNHKVATDEKLDVVIKKVLDKYEKYVKYNVGPNGIYHNETYNITMIKQLVREHTNYNDFIITADSDEFHKYYNANSAVELVEFMNKNGIDYIHGFTNERVSELGIITEMKRDEDLFIQYPKINNCLFSQPKISVIRAKYYDLINVGHHYVDDANNTKENESLKYYIKKYNACKHSRSKHFNYLMYKKMKNSQNHLNSIQGSETNHFRWTLQCKERILNWIKLFEYIYYDGWKDADKYKKMLNLYDKNLSEYIN